MRKKIAKISGVFATIGAIAIIISNFIGDYGYISFWIGVVVLVINGIIYLASGEKIRMWFWDIIDWF